MKNPWLNISWDNPIAESDRIRIEERYGSVDAFEKKYEEYLKKKADYERKKKLGLISKSAQTKANKK